MRVPLYCPSTGRCCCRGLTPSTRAPQARNDEARIVVQSQPQAVDKDNIDSWTIKDQQGKLLPASPDVVARWRRGLQACFAFAVSQGFKLIHVLGHVDPLHPVLQRPTTWRNLLAFGPRQKVGQAKLSYADVMVTPVVQALNAGAHLASSGGERKELWQLATTPALCLCFALDTARLLTKQVLSCMPPRRPSASAQCPPTRLWRCGSVSLGRWASATLWPLMNGRACWQRQGQT
jgi:hypothetical protein